jgi:hypothetical protein
MAWVWFRSRTKIARRIGFNEHGTKVFVTSILVVEAADCPAPPRKRAKRAKNNAA